MRMLHPRPRVKVLLTLIILSMLNSTGQSSSCDPDIPSRSLAKQEMAAFLMDRRPESCPPGQHLDGNECKPCPSGSFMTKEMARENTYEHCHPCYEPGMYEITNEFCTATRDAKIMCEDGYYRSAVPGKPCQSECRRCDVCGLGSNMFKDHEALECRDHQNTICCSEEDMVVVDGACTKQPTTPPTSPTASTPKSNFTTEYPVLPIDDIKVGFLRSSALVIHQWCHFHLALTVCISVKNASSS